MIIEYNKYINSGDVVGNTLNEKNNFSTLFDKIKSKMEIVNNYIIHHSITADGKIVEIGEEYYTIFKLIDSKSKTPFYRVGKVRVENIIEKKMDDNSKHKMFKYKKISIESPLQDTMLRDYRLVIGNKMDKKLSKNEIIGFYLYKEEIMNKQIPKILKRYNVTMPNEVEETPSDVDILSGNIYDVIKLNGKEIELGVFDIRDGVIYGYDYKNKQKYDNYKIQNIKSAELKGSLYDKYSGELKNYHLDVIKNLKEYKDLPISDKITYLSNTKDKVEKIRDVLNKCKNVNDIQKLKNSVYKLIKNIDRNIINMKDTVKSDSNKGDGGVIDDINTSEQKAKNVQVQLENIKCYEDYTNIMKRMEEENDIDFSVIDNLKKEITIIKDKIETKKNDLESQLDKLEKLEVETFTEENKDIVNDKKEDINSSIKRLKEEITSFEEDIKGVNDKISKLKE